MPYDKIYDSFIDHKLYIKSVPNKYNALHSLENRYYDKHLQWTTFRLLAFDSL